MAIKDYSVFLGTAVSAAQSAGAVIMKNLGTLGLQDIDDKTAADYVTRVDRESEELIIATLREWFPSHHILAEESLRDSGTDGYRWIIDPLDGTTNYIHGFPQFSVSIALQYGAELLVGVVFDPVRKELFTAAKGQGAFMNGRKISVSGLIQPERALIGTGFPFKQRELIDTYQAAFREVFVSVSDLRRPGSAALDLASVAAGRYDGFFEIGLNPWDSAAGGLLIREAGGVITDFGGNPDFLETGNIVAGSPAIHEFLLARVKRSFRGVLER